MRTAKTTNLVKLNKDNMEAFAKSVHTDLTNIFLALNGRTRFGSGSDGTRGENIDGEFRTFTTNASSLVNINVLHGLSSTPVGYMLTDINYPATLSRVASSSSDITFASSMTNVTASVFLMK